MLGKTNIIYVTKDQSSEMQFVAETVITRSSSNIVKMKYFNETFFAFTDENHILYGKNIMELEFLYRDGQPLRASDMEYYGGKYLFIDTQKDYDVRNVREASYYVSNDLASFEDYKISLVYGSSIAKIVGITINSYNQLTFLVALCAEYTYTGNNNSGYMAQSSLGVYTCNGIPEDGTFDIQIIWGSQKFPIGRYCCKSVFMRDRFLFYSNISEAGDKSSYCYCVTLDAMVKEVPNNQYPIGIIGNMAYASIGENTYYTLNFENYIKARSLPTECCIPIKGRIGLYNSGSLELASKVSDFAAGKTKILEISGVDYDVLCFTEADEYTYLGCQGGVIIQCFLDIDGIYQSPEIALVKSLAAQEALDKANMYTDGQISALRNYIDGKLP